MLLLLCPFEFRKARGKSAQLHTDLSDLWLARDLDSSGVVDCSERGTHSFEGAAPFSHRFLVAGSVPVEKKSQIVAPAISVLKPTAADANFELRLHAQTGQPALQMRAQFELRLEPGRGWRGVEKQINVTSHLLRKVKVPTLILGEVGRGPDIALGGSEGGARRIDLAQEIRHRRMLATFLNQLNESGLGFQIQVSSLGIG